MKTNMLKVPFDTVQYAQNPTMCNCHLTPHSKQSWSIS